jgi:hypothetical protein
VISQSEIRLLQRKADKFDANRERIDKYHAVWSALDNLVEAWEKLEGGRSHRPLEVEKWLGETMAPAVNRARRALGRKKPTGEKA